MTNHILLFMESIEDIDIKELAPKISAKNKIFSKFADGKVCSVSAKHIDSIEKLKKSKKKKIVKKSKTVPSSQMLSTMHGISNSVWPII